MRHLMSPLDFTVEEIDKLLDLASDIEAHPDKYAHACEGKKLATLFYEPSTRNAESGRQRTWLFFCRIKLCYKGRDGSRYDSHDQLLRRHLCNASS